MLKHCLSLLVATAALIAGHPVAADSAAKPDASKGMWKAAIPRVHMHGEFGNHDPIGLANGQRIKADCSLNWTDPDDGKLYCFSTPTSLAYFLYWPKTNSRRARAVWNAVPPS